MSALLVCPFIPLLILYLSSFLVDLFVCLVDLVDDHHQYIVCRYHSSSFPIKHDAISLEKHCWILLYSHFFRCLIGLYKNKCLFCYIFFPNIFFYFTISSSELLSLNLC